MDLGTVLSVAQTLFAALQCSQLKDICVLFGYESELENLRRTVCTVRAVLKDAEAKQDGLSSLSNQAQLYIDQLKDAVYDADDLLDEFITMIDQNKELIAQKGPILGEIRLFFSRFNRLSFARNMSKSVKEIRIKLDAIAVNYSQFGFKIDYEPIKLEAWFRESDINDPKVGVEQHPLSLPRFKEMVIVECPKMSCTPVEGLTIYDSIANWKIDEWRRYMKCVKKYYKSYRR